MNSDDEKRLAEIRAHVADIRQAGVLESNEETSAEWLLIRLDALRAKLDESERARRKAEEQSRLRRRVIAEDDEQYAAMRERAEKAEAALAKERAKREAAEEVRDNWAGRHAIVKARAEAAEARVRELEDRINAHPKGWV